MTEMAIWYLILANASMQERKTYIYIMLKTGLRKIHWGHTLTRGFSDRIIVPGYC